MLYKENGKKNIHKWIRKNVSLNINLDPSTRFDIISKIS